MQQLHWSQIVLLILSVVLFMYGSSSLSSGKSSATSSVMDIFLKKFNELNPSDMGSYILLMMACGVFILFVLSFCSNIQPMEQFESSICVGQTSMEDKITCAELQVRKLITRADAFTEGNLGNEGQRNPRLVANALGKSRSAAVGPLVGCSPGHKDDFENRLSRLETTLQSFTDPIFKDALSASNTCEGFETVRSNEERIAAILSLIEYQQTKYLKPIDDKVAALQRHEVSDCDKNKAAASFSSPN
jgi:hypothetical protein